MDEIDLYFNSIKKETPKSTPKSPTISPTNKANDIDSFFSNLKTTPAPASAPVTSAPIDLEPVVPEAPKKSIFGRYMDWSSRTQQKVADIEVDLWNRYKKIGEGIIADETISGIAKSWKSAFTEKTPEGQGAFVAKETFKNLGSAFTEGGKGILDFVTKQIPKTVATLEKGVIESIPAKEGGMVDKARDFLVSGYNVQIDDITTREQERQEQYADLPITAPQKLGYGIGSGLASIGTSVAIGVAGKSKWGASLVLSALDGSDTYNRARENLIVKKEQELGRPLTEEEKTTESAKAYGEMLLDTAGIAILEKVGLDWLLSSRGIWSKAVLETVQESTQTIWSNLVEKYGDNEAKKITDGLVETIITTLPVGAISSAGLHVLDTKLQAQGLSPVESQDLINRIQVRQEEEEKKLKEELDGAVKEENMSEDQKATMDALAEDINKNLEEGQSRESIAKDLSDATDINIAQALNIVNKVSKNETLNPVISLEQIGEEAIQEIQNPQGVTETPEANIDQVALENSIDSILKGSTFEEATASLKTEQEKTNKKLSDIEKLITESRESGMSELEITQKLQKENNLSLDKAVAEIKKYPKAEEAQPKKQNEAPQKEYDTPEAVSPLGAETHIRIGKNGPTTIEGTEITSENTKVSYKVLNDLGIGKQPVATIEKHLREKGVPQSDIDSILSRAPRIEGQTFTDNVFDAITAHNDSLKKNKEEVSIKPTPAETAPTLKLNNKLNYDDLLDEKIKLKSKIRVLERNGVKGDINDSKTPKGKELIKLKQALNFTENAMGTLREEQKKSNINELNKKYPEEIVQLAEELNVLSAIDEVVASGEAVIIDSDKFKQQAGDLDPKSSRKFGLLSEYAFEYALSVVANPHVKFLSGGPGSGKSEIGTEELKKGFDGIIFDAPHGVNYVVDRRFEMVAKVGKKASLYLIITDPIRARDYVLQREIIEGRAVTPEYHSKTHIGVVQNAKEKAEAGFSLYIRDVRNVFTIEEAKNTPWIDDNKEAIALLDSIEYNEESLLSDIKNVKLTKEQNKNATERARAKNEAQQTVDANRTEETKQARKSGIRSDEKLSRTDQTIKPTQIDSYYSFIKELQAGNITVAQYQEAFANFLENKDIIKAELSKKTVDQLMKRAGLHTRKSDGKASIIDSVLSGMEMRFALTRAVSYTIGEGGSKEAIQKLVNETTEADIENYVKKIAEQEASYKARVAEMVKATKNPETLSEFKTFIEINGEEKLTQEQRVKYEELVGLRAKEVEAKKIKDSGVISGVKADTVMTLSETTHSKTGEPLFKVSMADRIAKDQYIALNTSAKKLGGYYSSFSKGFLFKDKAMAEAFMNVGKGEKVETTRPEEMVAEKKQSVAEKLSDMADRLETMGNDKLNAPRKTNTARRANMASGMEADAQNDIAVAKTMKNLARAIASGEAKLLDRVSTKTQIETLNQLLRSGNYKQTRADSKETGTFKTNIPIDLKTVDFVDEFVPTFYIKGLEETVAKSKDAKGLIRSSQKVAESIRKAKAQGKEYYIPSVADMYEIVKINDGLSQNDVDWSTREHVATFKRLQAMGINSIEQLRATLREYIQFKETAVGPDEVKQLERSIIGKKVGVDFFPTPKNIATQMVDMASIEPGMKVLEPSAGNGNIAEVIRETGVNPDVAEISGDLRSILEAKGFNVVGNDFMNVEEKYDRIVMNPPFSNNQDIDHLQHAYSLLNEGGKVISIIGEGAFFRQGGKETDFRTWLDDLGASVEELPAGTFKDANLLATTGANARLVEIYKPETTKYKLTAETILNLKRDVNVTDIYGNKSVIPQGEALTPYVLGGSKILLKDGQEYIVNKNQYQNIKNQSVKADAKEFAPELKNVEEIIKGGTDPFEGLSDAEIRDELSSYEEDPTNMSIDQIKARLIEINDNDMGTAFNKEEGDTKFAQYQLPGGKNYKEILIKAPKPKKDITFSEKRGIWYGQIGDKIVSRASKEEVQDFIDRMGYTSTPAFKSSHWDELNIISHLRMNERTFDGKKVLFMEELQSDWAREGRARGFTKDLTEAQNQLETYEKELETKYTSGENGTMMTNAERNKLNELKTNASNDGFIPSNPFLKNWQELSIKRALKEAVDNNSEYFAWINGEQTSARYNLATHLNEAKWGKSTRGDLPNHKSVTLETKEKGAIGFAIDKTGKIVESFENAQSFKGKQLDEVLGKGLADKIMEKESGTLSGEGLKFGGEWANNLYDKQVKSIVEGLTGGKVEKIKLLMPEEFANIHYEGPTYSLEKLKEALKISQGYKNIFESPFTGEKNKFSFSRVSVTGTLKRIIEEIENGTSFKDAVSNVGSQEIAEYMGGEQVVDPLKNVPSEQQAIKLTPEIKAIIKSEALQLKQPSGAEPIESFKVNGVDNVIFDRTKEEIQAGFRKIFGREIPIETVFNAERDLKNIDALAQAFKSGIRLLEVNKSLSEVVANHEGWHWYKMQVSFTERAQITAIEMEYAKQNPEKLIKIKEVYKDQPGYGSEEAFAEELMADTLAEYYETGKTVFEKIQKWFSNALMKLKLLFSGRKDVLDMFKNIKKTLDDTTGNTRQFGQKLKIEKHPVFNTGDKLTDARLALEYAEKRNSEAGMKARRVPVGKQNIELPQDLTEKIIQIEVLEESIENNPIKELEKFEAKSGVFKGELPEVLGKTKEELKDSKFYNKYRSKNVLKFIKEGDKIVEGINMNYGTNMDTEEARVAYEKLKAQQEILKEQKKQVKQEVMDFKNEVKDQQALDNLAIQEDKKAITEARKVEMRKLMEETQARLKKEQDIEFRRNQNKNIAKTTAVKELGFWSRMLGQALNPLKYTDKITQNIFSNWNSKILQGKVRANKEAEAFVEIPVNEGMDVINSYEAGKESKYSKDIKTKFDSLLKEARTREVDMGFRENYLPHVYSENATEIKEKIDKYLKEKGMTEAEINLYMNGEKLPDARANLLKINPFFSKERIFPTYKVAMEYGLTPKYKNVAQLVGHYIQELETIVANNELVNELAEAGKILPFEEAPVLVWDMVNLPFAQKGYMAPPNIAKVINGLFGKDDPTFWTYTAWVSKKMQEIKLSAGLPYTTVNFFAIGQLVKEITAGNFKAANSFFRANFNRKSIDWMKENRNYVYMMARQGINLRETIDSWDNLYTNLSNIDGFAGKSQEVFDRMFSKKTFMSFMPMMQIQLFKDTYTTLVKKGYPQEIAEELAGRIISKNFGLSDFSGRSKATQDKLSATFFAPQFREGIINTLFNTGAAGVDFAKNLGGLKSPLDPTLTKNRKLLVGMIITYFLYNMLNRALNDDDDDENGGENIWENPENRKFALQIPLDDGTLIYVEFMPSFLAFARNMFSGAVGLGTGDFETATQKFGTIFSMPIKVVTEVLGNSDYFGRPIYKDTDTGTQKTYKIAKYMGLSVTHPYITEIVNQIEDKKPLYQSVIVGLELPLKFSTKDKVAQGEYYDALDAKAKENAKIKGKVQPVYDKIQKLKLEGKIEEATSLYNNLSEDEKITYNKIRISPYESTKIKNDAIDVAMAKLSEGNRNINQLEREVATSIYGKDYTPAQLTTATKEFAFVRVFGKDDELANDIKSAVSNAEKILLLKKARKEMGADKFREFFNKGRKTVALESGSDSYILISDDVREAYIKQQ
jgi:hypothetical protein